MEDEEKAPSMKPATRVQRLSTAAFNVLKDKGVSERTLQLFEGDLQGEEVDEIVKTLIKNSVPSAYIEYCNQQFSKSDITAAVDAAISEQRVIQSETTVRKKTREFVPAAFDIPYEGHADISFQNYLATCCHAYLNCRLNREYNAPYVTITQNSSFGKSRILKRLAEKMTLSAAVACQINGGVPRAALMRSVH